MLLLASTTGVAHHAISAKFDDKKPTTLTGVVTLVDWRNPHVHVFMNVKDAKGVLNWAVEIESPIDLESERLEPATRCSPATAITVRGILAQERQPSGLGQLDHARGDGPTGAQVHAEAADRAAREAPDAALGRQAAAARTDAGRRAGLLGVSDGDRAQEAGVNVKMDQWGLLANIADAPKVAPMQPWALALYRNRQSRFLQDDPTYLNCKPPGGPRQFQLALRRPVRRRP